ncbi:MAG: LytTR family DNA-binding domain-containing protein [Rikenellaceae bacterium]
MRCIAIDDEPMALKIISQYCSRFGDIELTTYSDPIVGMEQVRATLPDLLFLDIEMGGVNGVEIARTLPKSTNLIFTTAYAQFAIDGFELNAVDFLHKPFAYSRFERAVKKVQDVIVKREPEPAGEEIVVKVEYQNVKISIASIRYIEAMDNYVRIYIDGARPILSQMSMRNIETLLPNDRFMRIHKSYIISRSSIASYTRKLIAIKHDDQQLPIGRTYQAEFQNWIVG